MEKNKLMNVKLLPAIGKNYANGGIFGLRIMVLGESHYSSDDNDQYITQRVLYQYLNQENREKWMKTFLKFERSLVGRKTSPDDSHEIWNSVVFYNYLQVLMSGPREAGTIQQYKDASRAFFEVLEYCKPDVLIVWGKRLWRHLPWEKWTEGNPLIINGYADDNGIYTLDDGHQIKVISVYHPSAAYDWTYWNRVIKRFL